MKNSANTVTVTSALKQCLDSLNISYRGNWIFSDKRKPVGFEKAVGVKITGVFLTDDQRAAVRRLMEKKGYIFVADKTQARPMKAANPRVWRSVFKGTRFTYAQPKFVKA